MLLSRILCSSLKQISHKASVLRTGVQITRLQTKMSAEPLLGHCGSMSEQGGSAGEATTGKTASSNTRDNVSDNTGLTQVVVREGDLVQNKLCVEDTDSKECVEMSDSEECVKDTDSKECVKDTDSKECVETTDSKDCVEGTDSAHNVNTGKSMSVSETDSMLSNQNPSNNISHKRRSYRSDDHTEAKLIKPVDSSQTDPYAYTKADAFTSEIFKVEIQNFNRYTGIKQLKKKLAQWDVFPCKVKMAERSGYAFVNFRDEAERDKAIAAINGQVWKRFTLIAKKAKAAADPIGVLKRKHEEQEAEHGGKKARHEVDPRTVEERLKDAVTPLWRKEYQAQLQIKQDDVRSFIRTLSRKMEENPSLTDWLNTQQKENKGLCCKLLDIKQSPVQTHYRNKCEFSLGQSVDDIDKTVGFRLGAYKDGHVQVAWPGYCDNVNPRYAKVAELLEEYCRDHSDLSGWNPQLKVGNWRQVTIRTNVKNNMMINVLLHKEGLPQDRVDAEKEKVREFFTSEKVQKELGELSLYLEIKGDDRHEGTTLHHLGGDTHIYESLLQLTFRISPTSFFQVNTLAAELLYSLVGEWAAITDNTVLLDVCCGTGTIGLTMAKRVKKVVGIELNAQAVEDAKYNAQLNNLTNVEYHCGKAEDVLGRLIGQYRHQEVVAVVDPPRAGLHADVIQAIRRSEFIKRLVYVSCVPRSARSNLIDLTRQPSRRLRGEEFRLMQAQAVDLFPHTNHYELVMLFERFQTKEKKESNADCPIQSQDGCPDQSEVSCVAQSQAEGPNQSEACSSDASQAHNPDKSETFENSGQIEDNTLVETAEKTPVSMDTTEKAPIDLK